MLLELTLVKIGSMQNRESLRRSGSVSRGCLFKLVSLGIGLVFAALFTELAVRLVVGEQAKFPRHVVEAPWGLRRNLPGATYRHKSADVTVWFRINQQGMRADREYPYQKPPGVKRIVSLGDSFTQGYEVAAEETFSAVLERELRAQGHDAEVLNAGVSGFSNAEAYLYLERELWKYDPDVVLVSFYFNDLVDNVRTSLFTLVDGRLAPNRERYVPGGLLGDFLNSNTLFNGLNERSDAFTFLKERLTLLMKRQMWDENVRNLDQEEEAEPSVAQDYQRDLAAAIFDAMYESASRRGVPLVIQSIPVRQRHGGLAFVDGFPKTFDADRPGLSFFAAEEALAPFVGQELLYWTRSHGHWTPFGHQKSGESLAALMLRDGLLD